MFTSDLRYKINKAYGEDAWPNEVNEEAMLPTSSDAEVYVPLEGVRNVVRHIVQHGLAIPVWQVGMQ
jgi:hypothetical protein